MIPGWTTSHGLNWTLARSSWPPNVAYMFANDPDGQYALMQSLLEERRAEAARYRLLRQLPASRDVFRETVGAALRTLPRIAVGAFDELQRRLPQAI